MNTKLAATIVVGALLAPVAGYAADKPMKESIKENVGDAAITTKIKAEFAKDKTVSAMHIKVDTDDKGMVTLSGNAKSKAEADQAVKLARETKGVSSVTNNILVGDASGKKTMTENVKEAVSDSVITTKIKAEFAKDKTVSATGIKVDTEDKGVVTLGGNARSKAEADQAVKLARGTTGVISVHNNITIGDAGGKKAMTESAKENVGDAMITTKIKAEFAKDKMVSAMHIKVDTDDKGVVTLSGTAKSKAEADQAMKLARETKGVNSVKNDMVIGGASVAPVTGVVGEKSTTQTVKDAVTDSVITTKIKGEFAKDKVVSAMHVKVDTDDKGVVTLSGNAKSKAEADQAVKLARETKGVTSVKSDIVVQAK